jgi:outer membrane protein TolC
MQVAGAQYQQTVLDALRSVADVLRQLDGDARALQAQATADASARQALDLVQQQYRLGAASYLQLLVAQQQAQRARILLVAAQAARLADTAALYQAIGGGALAGPVEAQRVGTPGVVQGQAGEGGR